MKPKFAFLLALTLISLLLLPSCGKKEEAVTYKIVTPTYEEICELDERLYAILGMYWEDYDCEKENMYDNLFFHSHLKYIYPHYDEEVERHIAKPLNFINGHPTWNIIVYENDPAGKFDTIPDEIRDENGLVNEDLAYEFENPYDITIGHLKFSGPYIDWLVEGVWNGKTDHETFFRFDDGTLCYYYDGFYYTQELCGDRGGGVYCGPEVKYVKPLDNSKYEVKYNILDSADDIVNTGTAVVAMKESNDGFRFWSIFSIDIE